MKEGTDSNLIPVEIFGRTYRVRGEEDESYIRELARYVDAKIASVAETTRSTDGVKAAVLAALNIADELLKLRQECEEKDKVAAQRASEIATSLDQLLRDEREVVS